MDNLDQLHEWDEKIKILVKKYGLNCYPQEFEICDHIEMLGYMAYSGMPSRYSHWSYGKSYEREKTMYDYGVGGLPYELVINSNPCLAYLMQDNTELLQILTIAHVYGHNDFFANNFTFTSSLDAKYTLELFKNHANRVRGYIEDPSIGQAKVEHILDSAHALSLQRSRNLAIKKLSPREEMKRMMEDAQPKQDEFSELHEREKYVAPDLSRFPLSPDPNILDFISKHNPTLSSWQRDLISIVDQEASYFIPQIETKIMNEGWASYWHHKMLNNLGLSHGHHLEFLVKHNQVLRPTPGGLNPYHLGFIIWHDIERRWNEGDTGEEYSAKKPKIDLETIDENDSPGRKKIFQVRESDRDVSFLRRFLTPEIMASLDMFQHEKRGKERVITKISEPESWKEVKETLLKNVGCGSIPVIQVHDADFGGKRSLHLKHDHDGRDLQLEYCEKTLDHVQALWGREVLLETIVNGRPSMIKLVDGTLKVERI